MPLECLYLANQSANVVKNASFLDICILAHAFDLHALQTYLNLQFDLVQIAHFFFLSPICRDPLAISLLLRSRHFNSIAFITDCVLEGVPGKTVKYGNRQSKLQASSAP